MKPAFVLVALASFLAAASPAENAEFSLAAQGDFSPPGSIELVSSGKKGFSLDR
jgi:hypothetical protein